MHVGLPLSQTSVLSRPMIPINTDGSSSKIAPMHFHLMSLDGAWEVNHIREGACLIPV